MDRAGRRVTFPALEGLGLGTRSSSARPVSSLWTEPELIKRPHLHPFARVASPFPTASAALAGAQDQGLVLDGGAACGLVPPLGLSQRGLELLRKVWGGG